VASVTSVPFYGSVMTSDDRGTVVAGYDGELVALDTTGTQLWSADEHLEEVVNAPVLVEDIVVVPSRQATVAVDRITGARLWQSELRQARLADSMSGGRAVVLATTPDGILRAIDPTSGAELMKRALPAPLPDGAPPLDGSGGVAVVAWGRDGDCCTIAGFDISDGQMLWTRNVDKQSTEPVVFDGLVIVAVSDRSSSRGRVVAFDVVSGTRRWRSAVRGRFVPGLRGDATDDIVVIPSRDGSVIAADVETGEIQWTSADAIPADQANPKIAAGQVFLTPHSSDLVALDRETGELLTAGPIERVIVVTDTDVVDEHFQLLVTNGLESQVWSVEPDGLRA
jgi:outer membrane protein assembly factor BamB